MLNFSLKGEYNGQGVIEIFKGLIKKGSEVLLTKEDLMKAFTINDGKDLDDVAEDLVWSLVGKKTIGENIENWRESGGVGFEEFNNFYNMTINSLAWEV